MNLISHPEQSEGQGGESETTGPQRTGRVGGVSWSQRGCTAAAIQIRLFGKPECSVRGLGPSEASQFQSRVTGFETQSICVAFVFKA